MLCLWRLCLNRSFCGIVRRFAACVASPLECALRRLLGRRVELTETILAPQPHAWESFHSWISWQAQHFDRVLIRRKPCFVIGVLELFVHTSVVSAASALWSQRTGFVAGAALLELGADRRGTSEFGVQISWQAQYFGAWRADFVAGPLLFELGAEKSWQAQCFGDLSALEIGVQISWQG